VNLLLAIWLSAAVLALGALAWMSGLIVMRLVFARSAARRLGDRRKLEAALIAVMQRKPEGEAALAPFRGRARLLAETLLDFLALVRGDDRQVTIAALEHIGADRTLRARIDRGSLAGRLASVEALGAFPGPRTQFALLRASERGAPDVRIAALRSLRQAGGEVRLGQLIEGLEAGAFPPSGAFVELLRLVVVDDTAAAMAALQSARRSPVAQVLLLESLGLAGAYDAIPVVTPFAGAPTVEVRVAAVEALGSLMHPAGQLVLRQALEDPAWEVRAAAADGIGNARLSALVDPLAVLLDDPVWRVRAQAAAALGKLGPAGIGRLRASAASDDDVARRAAQLVLAELA
jgi:HEAT repeat protein